MSRLPVLSFYFLVAVCVLAPTAFANEDKDVCDQWTSIAHKVTGSGMLHKCATRPKNCTVLDCSGDTTFSHNSYPLFIQHDIDLSYCFGMQVNPCYNPISMDFYLQLPSRNISKSYRIQNDDIYEIKELNLSFGNNMSAYPLLNFQFERGDSKTVNLSVTAQLKGSNAVIDILLQNFKFTLISEQVIPVKSCPKIVQDSRRVPLKEFAPRDCQLKPSTPVATTTPSEASIPSSTLNKACSIEQQCSVREMCDLDAQKCMCSPEFFLSPKQDACLSSSKINQSCDQNEECGYNEECRLAPSNRTCQCVDHHFYSTVRGACILPMPGQNTAEINNTFSSHTETTTIKDHKSTGSEDHKSTGSEDHKSTGSEANNSSGSHNIPIFVGCGVAALVLVCLVVWGLVMYKKKKQRPLSISDRECSAPLIGSDDSDNLVM